MRSGYSTFIDAENDFILDSHILAKHRKKFKNKINFKTDSNFKESTSGEIRKHGKQIAGLIGSLNKYSNAFHGAAWNMVAGDEIPSNITNWLLLARKYATVTVEQFTKKRLLSQEVNFYDPIQRITKATLLKKKKQRNVTSTLKEDCWIICDKIAWETWGIKLSFNNRPTNSLYAWKKIVSTKNQVSF